MQKFRLLIVLLVVVLALFFNIERLDFGDNRNVVDIPTFTYVFATVAILSILLGLPFRRTHIVYPLTFWFAIYFACRSYMFYGQSLWGDANFYVLMTEVSFLAILLSLAHLLADSLNKVKKSVQDIDLVNRQSLRTLDSAIPAIRTELTRSRHYERKLSLILVDVEPTELEVDHFIREMQAEFGRHYAVAKVAKEISCQLREIDQVLLGNKPNQLVVLCPETSHDDGELIFSRIQPWVASRVKAHLHYGVATFPEDGITLNGLLTHAGSNSQGNVETSAVEISAAETSAKDKSSFSHMPSLGRG